MGCTASLKYGEIVLELNELKLVTASNLIRLRTQKGLTQAELGAMLNYSDKTISKWERGAAIPDAYVLTQLADIFSVSVDYLLSSHDAWENPEELAQQAEDSPVAEQAEAERRYSENMICALTVASVWTACTIAFVVLWLTADIIWWQIFAIAMPISLLVLIILMSVFKKFAYLQYSISLFVISIFAMLYCIEPERNAWQLFLVCVPAVAVVFLACNIHKTPLKRRKHGTK